MDDKFPEQLLFTYYRYLDRMHSIPCDFKDLFDFVRYNEVDSEINAVMQEEAMKDRRSRHGK